MATKLVGRNGKISVGVKGSEVDGDGATPLVTDGWYVAKTILASGSGLPTGLEVDILFQAAGTETPEIGETVIPFTFTDQCDIVSCSIDKAIEEIDVTTLCNTEKEYEVGRSDLTGTLNGIMTLDVSELWINKGWVTVSQTADRDTVTISEINTDTVYLRIEVQKSQAGSVPFACYFAPVIINGNGSGVQVDGAQTFSGGFRVTPDDDVRPVYYKQFAS